MPKIEEPRRKRGRPKGSKSKLPFVTFPGALNYSKILWDNVQYNEVSFKHIKSLMKLHEQKCVRVLGVLKDYYGVLEQTDAGYWRLTEAGRGVAKDDPSALKEVFSKDSMFSDLYQTFGDRNVMESVILDYIEKNYKGIDAEEATQRFLDGMQKIKEHSTQKSPGSGDKELLLDFVLSLFQLKYALTPPSDKEMGKLVDKVVEKLSKTNDDTLKLIAELMSEEKNSNEKLAKHLDRAMERLKLNVPEGTGEERTQSD